jgi:uncharacterized membrane protein YgcG
MRRLISLIILIMILCAPVFVMADTKSYSIDKLIENVVINEDGSIEIHEEFTYSFKGDFNGIYRNLLKNGASHFTLLEVVEKDSKGNVTPIIMGGNSENNTYELSEDSNAWRIKLFSKSNNEVKTFIFRYIMHDAAIKTATSSELYWNFYTVENNTTVGNVELNLALKNADFDMDKFKFWSYVDGKDFTTNYDAKGLHIKGRELTSLLGIRVLFQPEYLKIPVRVENNDNQNHGTPDFHNNTNNFSKHYKVIQNGSGDSSFTFIFAIIVIIVAVLLYNLYQHNKKFQEELSLYRAQAVHFNQEIYTCPPSDLPPALVNFLVYERSLSASMILPNLFYLSKRGYYTLEKRTYKTSGFFKQIEEEDLAFKRNHQPVTPESPHLEYFMNWFSLYEDRGCFTLKGIEEQVKDRSGALAFRDEFSKWEGVMRQEACDLGFHTNIYGKQVLTNEYYDEQQKWLGYKKYLLRQLNSSSDTLSEDVDDALIYAQTLEIGSEQLESLSQKLYSTSTYDEASYHHKLYNNNAHQLYPYFFMSLHLWDNINNNVNLNSGSSDDSISNGFTGGDGSNFGGSSDGGGFTGGGGGDSGAF